MITGTSAATESSSIASRSTTISASVISSPRSETPLHRLAKSLTDTSSRKTPEAMQAFYIEKIGLAKEALAILSQIPSEQKIPFINHRDSFGYPAHYYAALFNHTFLLKVLLDNGADVRIKIDNNSTILHTMVKQPNLPDQILFNLLENGADVTAADVEGNTPLHLACSHPNTLITVKILLNLSVIDANALNQNRDSALDLALRYGYADNAMALLNELVLVESDDPQRVPPLHMAIALGDSNLVDKICHRGANTNKIFNGLSPLFRACNLGFGQIVKVLLERGSDPEQILPFADGNKPIIACLQTPEVAHLKKIIDDFKAAQRVTALTSPWEVEPEVPSVPRVVAASISANEYVNLVAQYVPNPYAGAFSVYGIPSTMSAAASSSPVLPVPRSPEVSPPKTPSPPQLSMSPEPELSPQLQGQPYPMMASQSMLPRSYYPSRMQHPMQQPFMMEPQMGWTPYPIMMGPYMPPMPPMPPMPQQQRGSYPGSY